MNDDTSYESLQEILSKIDKLKVAINESQSNKPISQEVVGFIDDIKEFINDISDNNTLNIQNETNEHYDEIIDQITKIHSQVSDLIDINNNLNINYSKLVTKPLKLLELLHSEINNGNNLQSELGTISNAINTLKDYEFESVQNLSNNSLNIVMLISEELNNLSNNISNFKLNNYLTEFLIAHKNAVKRVDEKLAEVYNLLGYNREEMLKNIENELDSEKMVEVDVNESTDNLDLEEQEFNDITNVNEDFKDEIEDEMIDKNEVDVDFYEDVEIEEEDEIEDDIEDEDEHEMKNNEDYEAETNPQNTTYKSKFDESYLDIDESNDDDNDLLKYYK